VNGVKFHIVDGDIHHSFSSDVRSQICSQVGTGPWPHSSHSGTSGPMP
jgi:hypothetical protein